MNSSYKRWKTLFLFCLGLAAGAAFCMKWMESDLWANNEQFTIMGLELFYSKSKMFEVFSAMDPHVKTILGYHLHFDFAFMAGVYPGISALCMMTREKVHAKGLRQFLFILASLQLVAWAADIIENLYLLKWTERPVIGDEFVFYHFIVSIKWIIALVAAVIAIAALTYTRKNKKI